MMSSQPPELHFESEDVGPVTVVHVQSREIRHPSAALEFGNQLRTLIEEHGRTRLAIDLKKTHYLCSTGFSALLTIARALKAMDGAIALCNLDPEVAVGARIIGIDRITPIFDDEDEAIEAVRE